jgi:hypothetical protein
MSQRSDNDDGDLIVLVMVTLWTALWYLLGRTGR